MDLSTPPFAMALLADTTPLAEAGTAAAGNMATAARGDHRHPRLSSTFSGTLDGNGLATLTFTRTFSSVPGLTVIAIENDNNPSSEFKIKTWTTDGNGNYTGCVIYGSRPRALPASLVLLSALSNFLPVQAAAGVAFTGFAIQPSVAA
jgi:hypothetical protein